MRNPRVVVLGPLGRVPEPLVEAQRLHLRVQFEFLRAALAPELLDGPHQPGAEAGAAGGRDDGEPAEQHPVRDAAGDGERLRAGDQSRGAERRAVLADGEQVRRGRVVLVVLQLGGDLLLLDEDGAPHRPHLGELVLVRGDPDGHRHLSSPRR